MVSKSLYQFRLQGPGYPLRFEPFQILLIPVETTIPYLVLIQNPFPQPQLSNAHML